MGDRESWLETYLRYTERLESPTQFHRWTAIAVCGLLLGRRIWLSKEGSYAVFPGQIMVCLVADSSMLRKSTAIRMGLRLLDAVRDEVPQAVNRLVDRTSPQAMLHDLTPRDESGEPIPEADACACIVADELGAFFSSESFLETIATHVTTLNDAPTGVWNPETLSFAPYTYRMRFMGSGETVLRNPCIGILGGTTPTGLARELPQQAKAGGFFARVLPIYAAETDRQANAMLSPNPPGLPKLARELVDGLLHMRKLHGLVQITGKAQRTYTDWYMDFTRTNPGRRLAATLHAVTGYYGRKQDHVLRVAMILAAMDWYVRRNEKGKLRLWIGNDHIEQSLRYLAEIERDSDRAFSQLDRGQPGSVEGQLSRMLSRRFAKYRGLTRKQWLSRQYLVKRLHERSGGAARAAHVEQALAQLAEVGAVVHRGETKMTRAYRWLPKSYLHFARENQQIHTEDGPDEDH